MRVWNKLTAALAVALCLLVQPAGAVCAAPVERPVQAAKSARGEWDGPSRGRAAPNLKDGEVKAELLGAPVAGVSEDQLQDMRSESNDGPAAAGSGEQIPDGEFIDLTFVYINGEPCWGGVIEVTEGDTFSYSITWVPAPGAVGDDPWGGGDWFEIELFTVPGLSLPDSTGANLVIDGIKVGAWKIEYDRETSTATYRVEFTPYMRFFDPTSVVATVRGSGTFTDANAFGPIEVDGQTGTLTVKPRPTEPSVPEAEGGTGWQPSLAPSFNDVGYGFGEGLAWTSAADAQADPLLEWRVVFFEYLQKLQRQFAESGDGDVLEPSEKYVIVEDTLDANQHFCHLGDDEYHALGETRDAGLASSAPFLIELPVIVPGTGTILNGPHGVGDASSYDGPGSISSVVTAENFMNMTDPDETPELVKVDVENTPLSWAVTTDPQTQRETLTINMGKLGATAPTDGLVWGHAEDASWPVAGLEDLIDECDRKVGAVRTGGDSPVTLLDKRQGALVNLLKRAALLQDDPAAANGSIAALEENYRAWRENPAVGPLQPLKDPSGAVAVPLPDVEMAKGFEDWKASDGGTAISETGEYQDYLASLGNLLADQDVYLDNRTEYGKGWEQAKRRYEEALDFYKATSGIFGFTLKVRTESVNTSATTYDNSVSVRMDSMNWAASEGASVTFDGAAGNYRLRDVVVQKADALYGGGDTEAAIELVDDEQAGLAGAEFQVYCGQGSSDTAPELSDQNRAQFLDKDASENGATYTYVAKAGSLAGSGAEPGLVDTLVTAEEDGGNDRKGRFALGGLAPEHSHWLVETKAPAGYYLDATPRRIEGAGDKVTYELVPNVSRSVLLKTVDALSDNPVAGATFTLYRKVDGVEREVTGFDAVTVNGHETLWKSANGTGGAALATNDDGELCIHGLDAGAYVLRETQPAPGYLLPSPAPEYEFTLHDELPSNDGAARYDDTGHLLLTDPSAPLGNEPGTADLTVKKQGEDGNGLAGAKFSLFRFTGTEEEWEGSPDAQDLWEAVSPSEDGVDGAYFKTGDEVGTIALPGAWEGPLTAVLTGGDGSLGITDIPVGHYSIAETGAPAGGYVRDYRSFYFTVDGDTVNTDVKLYLEPQEKTELPGNVLVNYEKSAQIALVAYDAAAGGCGIEAAPEVNDGWHYSEERLNQAEGLEGAVYKLFMRRGASVGVTNPDPQELETEIIKGSDGSGYDACLAVGTTDENGVLRLSDMKDGIGKFIPALNPKDYYLVEITPPNGYLLDQSPVEFKIDEKVLAGGGDDGPGLIMAAPHEKVGHGFRLRTVVVQTGDGAGTQGVAGAGFEVRSEDNVLSFVWVSNGKGHYRLADAGSEGAVSTVHTDADGSLDIRGLAGGGRYTLTETVVPRGFKQPENPITVEVALPTEEGRDEGEGTLEGGVLYPNEETVVENERLLGAMSLRKLDAETFKPLEGARFGLYRTDVTVIPPSDPMFDPQNPDATRSEDVFVREGVTNKDGDLTFEELAWAPSYYVRETAAPEGYVLDGTRYSFSIDERSFSSDGTPIEVQFPLITNSVGTLGHATLTKVDAESGEKLPGAHFLLEKCLGKDASGKQTWVGYGAGVYITDAAGAIDFFLPPGRYRVTELRAPEGYITDAKTVEFAIEKGAQDVVVIDDGDGDGVIGNVKGETGVLVKKTLGTSDVPVPGATFTIGWEVTYPDSPTEHVPLSFLPNSEGGYEYTVDPNAPSATTRLVTDGNGEISALLPKSLIPPTSGLGIETFLACWEVDAPSGLAIDSTAHRFTLTEGAYTEVRVANDLNQSQQANLAIDVRATDGSSKKGLEGVEFELRWCSGGPDDDCEAMPPLATGVTDRDGNLTFRAVDVAGSPGLRAGETYHIVETKAPAGYAPSRAHHEVTLDGTCFDDEFNFTGASVNVVKYRGTGSVALTKVSAEDASKALPGAEFELLELVANGGEAPRWVHCGEHRYATGEDGRLRIDGLPFGTYKLVETAAPWGYVLDDSAWEREFSIDDDHAAVDLGAVENAPSPNPARDVRVKKVAAHDHDRALPGAEFQLYVRSADGSYGLAHAATFTTGSAGEFAIEGLPVGSYALKEVTAPEGYQMPQDNLTEFAVRAEDGAVELKIENTRAAEEKPEGPEGNGNGDAGDPGVEGPGLGPDGGNGDTGDPGADPDGGDGDSGVDSDPNGGAGDPEKPGTGPGGQEGPGGDATGGANAQSGEGADGTLAGTGDESAPLASIACAGALLAAVGMGLRPPVRRR